MVVLAIVAKSVVEVALVVVEFNPVKFCKVVEPKTSRLANVPRPLDVRLPPMPVVKKRLVVDAVVENRLVVVADVVVDLVMLLKIFAPEKVLLSERRVEEAAPEEVSTQMRPLAVVFIVPTVEVAREMPPVLPLMERTEVEVVAVPATVVVAR